MFFSRGKKLLAIVLSVSLSLLDSYALAAPARTPSENLGRPLQSESTSSGISIPPEFGRIEESATGGFEKTIIYLQDAHDSLEAQENIARLIDYLVERYGVKTVFEEGYEGLVPTDEYFEFIKDREIKKKVSYFLMDKLRIGGAEYAHINRRKDFKLIGADDLELHLDNIKFYRDASGEKDNIARDLAEIRREIVTVANRHFPKELKQWMKLKRHMAEDQLSLLDYLRQVPFDKGPYRNITILLSSESGKDSDAAEQVKAIDPKMLFEEIEQMEDDFTNSLLSSKRDRTIVRYYKYIELLERLNNIRLSAAEYETVKSFLRGIKTRELAYAIARHAKKSVVFSKRWEKAIQDAINFYEAAHTRDDAIKERLKDFKNGSEKIAVLVFGGFHKGRIKQIIEKSFSYYVVAPRMTEISPRHQAYYQRLMSIGYHPFEAPFHVRTAARPRSILSLQKALALSEIQGIYEGILHFPDGGPALETYLLRKPLTIHRLATQNRSEARMDPRLEQEIRQMREELAEDGNWSEQLLKILNRKIEGPIRVYYPGAGTNLIGPIVNVDADILIAVDYLQADVLYPYIKQALEEARVYHYAIEKTDTKFTIRFYYNGKERVVHYYSGIDAGREEQLPPEVTAGFEIYYESLLTFSYGGRSGSLETELDPVALEIALKYLRPGGFIYADYDAAKALADSSLHSLNHFVSYFAPEGRKIPAVLKPPKETREFSFSQLNQFIRENGVSVVLIYWPLAMIAASSLFIASLFIQEPLLRWSVQIMAGMNALAGQYMLFYAMGNAFKSLHSQSKKQKTAPVNENKETDELGSPDSHSEGQTPRSEVRRAEHVSDTPPFLTSDTAVMAQDGQERANRSVIFIDGTARYKEMRARVEELAVLAASDRTRTLVVYNIEKKVTEIRERDKFWNLLKSFGFPNIRFVAGSLADVVKPYHDRGGIDLVQYSAEEKEAAEAIAQTGGYKERLIYFVGKPGALCYGLRNLEAVKINKPVEDIIFQNGYHVITDRASAWFHLIQRAQFVTVFATSA